MHSIDEGTVPAGADRFDSIEALLARYPHVTDSELSDLKHWFRREATSFEVASMASKEAIHGSYLLFRKEHLDRLTFADAVKALASILLVLAILLAFILLER